MMLVGGGPSRNSMQFTLLHKSDLKTTTMKKNKGLSIPAIDNSNLKFKSKERILNLSSTIDVVSGRHMKNRSKLQKNVLLGDQDSLFDNEMLSSQMTSLNRKFNVSTQKYLKKSQSSNQGSIFEKQKHQKESMLQVLREQ